MIRPARPRPGDRIGLIAPAGPVDDAGRATAVAQVQALGFVPVLASNAAERRGYLAGTDAARARGVSELLNDPTVRGFIALRGGYGTQRILGSVQWGPIVRDPRPVVGYSDLTALHAALWRLGVISLHGPMAALPWSVATQAALRRALTDPGPMGPVPWPPGTRPRTLRGGRARGRLAGGNLTTVAAMRGSGWAHDLEGTVLLLEEVGEAPYAIDRLLWQLRDCGALAGVRAVILGEWVRCSGDDPEPVDPSRVVLEALGREIPVLGDLPVGHGQEILTLPLGVEVEVDADRGSVTVLEPHLRP